MSSNVMKTLVCAAPGQMTLRTAAKPIPKKGNALVRIKRVGICGTDLHAYQGNQPYFEYPRILGHELAGDLVDAADDIAGFEKGETVTVLPYFSCGKCMACISGKTNCCVHLQVCGVHCDGGFAEYLSVPVSNLVKGQGLSYDMLAMVEPFSIAAHSIRRANIKSGEYVLIVGLGPIGLAIAEMARVASANVIGLDVNEGRLAFAREKLKVRHTINPLTTEVLSSLLEITDNNMPEVVIDATGNLRAIEKSFDYLSHTGRYILVGLQKGNISFSHPDFHKKEATLMSSRNATRADFDFVIQSIKNKSIDPSLCISDKVSLTAAATRFQHWLNPENNVIKAIVDIE